MAQPIRDRDVLRALSKLGGVQIRGKGSHTKVLMPNGKHVTVVKGDNHISYLKRSVKRAVSWVDFLDALK